MSKKTRARGLHRLTALEVRALKRPGWYGDGGGLYVFISRPGTGSWVYRYGTKNMGLGSISVVSLADARERARACRELRAAGVDPRARRDQDRTAAKVAAARTTTFDQCAVAYIAAHKVAWRNPKHRQQWTNTLATYCSPVFGDLPVARRRHRPRPAILEPIWSEQAGDRRPGARTHRGRFSIGRRRAAIATARTRRAGAGISPSCCRRRSSAPRVDITRRCPIPSSRLSWRSCASVDGVAARALEFTILTAARTGEVLGATWEEIDLAAKVWTIPAERMKAGGSTAFRSPRARWRSLTR